MRLRAPGPDRPWRGHAFTRLDLDSAPTAAPTVLFAATASSPTPLPGTPCTLWLDPSANLTEVAVTTTDAIGNLSVGIPIPSTTPPRPVFFEFVTLDGDGRLVTSSALRVDVR